MVVNCNYLLGQKIKIRKIVQLFERTYVGTCERVPANRVSVKICVNSLPSVRGSALRWATTRNLSDSSSKCETLGRDGKSTRDNETGRVDSDNKVIYYGGLTPQIKGLKVFTCTSSLGGLIVQPIIVKNILFGENLPLGLALGTAVGFFTFVTPFLIHLLTKKYVTEIRYNEKTDTYEVSFKIEDVTVPDSLPLFTTMAIKGRPLFVISDSFLVVSHYVKMMGYDKPIDLKMDVSNIKLESTHLEKGKKSVTPQT